MTFFLSNKIEEIPKEKEQGTKLIIDNLREWWSEAMIKRVYRYALDVLQPFPLSKVQDEIDSEVIDPGFEIRFSKDSREIASQESMFYQHALAEIEGFVNENGDAFWIFHTSQKRA